jgi:hypothetical protein
MKEIYWRYLKMSDKLDFLKNKPNRVFSNFRLKLLACDKESNIKRIHSKKIIWLISTPKSASAFFFSYIRVAFKDIFGYEIIRPIETVSKFNKGIVGRGKALISSSQVEKIIEKISTLDRLNQLLVANL